MMYHKLASFIHLCFCYILLMSYFVTPPQFNLSVTDGRTSVLLNSDEFTYGATYSVQVSILISKSMIGVRIRIRRYVD